MPVPRIIGPPENAIFGRREAKSRGPKEITVERENRLLPLVAVRILHESLSTLMGTRRSFCDLFPTIRSSVSQPTLSYVAMKLRGALEPQFNAVVDS